MINVTIINWSSSGKVYAEARQILFVTRLKRSLTIFSELLDIKILSEIIKNY